MSIVRSHSKEGRRGFFGSGNGRLFWKMGARQRGNRREGQFRFRSFFSPGGLRFVFHSDGDFEDVEILSMPRGILISIKKTNM